MDIEKSKERCKELIKEAHAGWIGISNQVAIETVLNELEKKDLIINEMAKCMEIEGTARRGFSCMFKEDGECNEYGCKVCIKEYFTNKAENVGE